MKKGRYAAGFAVLALLLIFFIILNLSIGSVRIPVNEIWGSVFSAGDSTEYHIIRDIRLPRLVAAMLLGGALSLSGLLLQTFFHNPIAGPYVLGVSSAAKLVVALLLIFSLKYGIHLSSFGMILGAFAGSMFSMVFILFVSSRVNSMSILIICGVMTGYICSAITDIAVTFADDSNIVNLHSWSLGSFSGISSENNMAAFLVIFAALIFTLLISKQMSAYLLGEVYAANLGVNIKRFRACLILLSGILSSCVTAFAGPVSFVGIAVPHLIRNIFKTEKPVVMIPACFLGGAVFCLLCDLIARSVFAPSELSISTVTSVFGAPVVIWLLFSRGRRREGYE
ncbi:MAG: iron ABC transporter permease [Lachnospiraceae bacterium]|nr:iron ABC transporter permease [Lachnospiraceae bacterium]